MKNYLIYKNTNKENNIWAQVYLNLEIFCKKIMNKKIKKTLTNYYNISLCMKSKIKIIKIIIISIKIIIRLINN